MQNRDVVQAISLPKLKNPLICPFRALKALSAYIQCQQQLQCSRFTLLWVGKPLQIPRLGSV